MSTDQPDPERRSVDVASTLGDGDPPDGPAEELGLTNTSAAEAARMLAQMSVEPTFERDLRDIIERTLAAPGRPMQQARQLYDRIGAYTGDDDVAMSIIYMLAYNTGPDEQSVLDHVDDPVARDHVGDLLRRLAGLYGVEINRYMQLTSRPAKDWRYIEVTTQYELEPSRWLIDIDLEHIDGTHAQLMSEPYSVLRLVNHLLIAMNGIDITKVADGTPTALFDADDMDTFLVEVGRFVDAVGEGIDDEDVAVNEDDEVEHIDADVSTDGNDTAGASAHEPNAADT